MHFKRCCRGFVFQSPGGRFFFFQSTFRGLTSVVAAMLVAVSCGLAMFTGTLSLEYTRPCQTFFLGSSCSFLPVAQKAWPEPGGIKSIELSSQSFLEVDILLRRQARARAFTAPRCIGACRGKISRW